MKKLKKACSLTLALVLALSLTVPALAANTLTGSQIYPNSWGNGPSLTLKGVTGERAVDLELPYCYDVEAGGSLVLDMPFPAGKNRAYTIMAAGVYIAPDFTDCADNGQDWDVANGGGVFVDDGSGGKQYAYNFTESDMGQEDGFDKAIYMSIYWDEGNGDQASDYGSAYFYIHVVPAKSGSSGYQVSDWARDRVAVAVNTKLAPEGLGNDYRKDITRSQFAATAVKLYEAMSGKKAPAAPNNPFTDTSDPAILQAANLGFVSGVGDGKFEPNSLVTREQAAVMLSSVYAKLGGRIPTVSATSFADNAAVSSWAKNAVAFMNSKSIVSGVGGNQFDPQGSASIEQALLIALKMFETLR